jgi:hypothetical protein
MNKYRELKDRQSKELGEFEGLFFAFNNEQFAEGMAKWFLKHSKGREICKVRKLKIKEV